MTIQDLFAKLSKPGQKRVSYGIYWAINKMSQCGTKSYCDNCRHIFQQWVSYTTANYILPKLHDFSPNGRDYVGTANIDGDVVVVTYTTGMASGNVRISINVMDSKKYKQEVEEMARIENENAAARIKKQEIMAKISKTFFEMYEQNNQTSKEEYMEVISSRFDEEYAHEAFKVFGWIK